MTLELYNAPHSTCSQKVRLTLAEKTLDFVEHHVSLWDNEHLTDWYLKLNPNGVVPTLVHDGQPVIDSSVINEYLDEVFPHAPLIPGHPLRRAKMRAWRQYIDEVPTPAIRIPSFNGFIFHLSNVRNPSWTADRFAKAPIRKPMYRRMGSTGFGQQDMDEALERLRASVVRMNESLHEGPWLVGNEFTLADISMIPNIVRLHDLELNHVWADLPRVEDWFERVQQRPSFAKAYYEGSRVKPVKADTMIRSEQKHA